MKQRKVEFAHSITVSLCDCGCRQVYLESQDATGQTFSVASMTFDELIELAGDAPATKAVPPNPEQRGI